MSRHVQKKARVSSAAPATAYEDGGGGWTATATAAAMAAAAASSTTKTRQKRQKRQARESDPLHSCATILHTIQANPDAFSFLQPLDWVADGLTDYLDVIPTPMDLRTVEGNLESGHYASQEDFAQDMRRIWKNAMTYFRIDSPIFVTSERLARLFEQMLNDDYDTQAAAVAAAAAAAATSAATVSRARDGDGAAEDADARVLLRDDQRRLVQFILQLSVDHRAQLLALIQKLCPAAITSSPPFSERNVAIDTLDAHSLREATHFCTKCRAAVTVSASSTAAFAIASASVAPRRH